MEIFFRALDYKFIYFKTTYFFHLKKQEADSMKASWVGKGLRNEDNLGQYHHDPEIFFTYKIFHLLAASRDANVHLYFYILCF